VPSEPLDKPWWETLLGLLAGVLTRQALDGLSQGGVAHNNAATSILELPSLYSVAQPPDLPESRELSDCHEELQVRFNALKADYEATTNRQLYVTCTWRSQTKQAELYAQGRTAPGQIVTQIDGVTRKSRHMVYPSQAVDVAIDYDPGPGKHLSWDTAAYQPLGPLCEKHGLVWGGSWHGFKDYPHIELPAGYV
jgi:hypothetical protein